MLYVYEYSFSEDKNKKYQEKYTNFESVKEFEKIERCINYIKDCCVYMKHHEQHNENMKFFGLWEIMKVKDPHNTVYARYKYNGVMRCERDLLSSGVVKC